MTDRRRLLGEVRKGFEEVLTPAFANAGFRFTRRDATFHRTWDGVAQEFRLAISSRPASLAYDGILVEPLVVASVAEWVTEAERWMKDSSGLGASGERPGPVVFEFFDWLVPGERPHWTLPDDPTADEVEQVAHVLRTAVVEIGLPFLERIAAPDRLLLGAASGELQVPESARYTLACGAMMAERPDLARALIEQFGTARRESVAATLGLTL